MGEKIKANFTVMKNKTRLFCLCLSMAAIVGCKDSTILEGPPVVKSVELNVDSATTHLGRTYKIYLKAEKGVDPVFYTNRMYNSGDILGTASMLESDLHGKMEALMDTIESQDKKIRVLNMEIESMRKQLDEKSLLIRFLTGK